MKEFKIVFGSNASTDEITDSIADVFHVAITVEKTLKDGFQLTDILAAVQLEPVVREVINDFPVFIDQFKGLDGATALMAVNAAKDRTIAQHGELGKVGTFAYEVLEEAALTATYIQGTIVGGMQRIDSWKTIAGRLKKPAA